MYRISLAAFAALMLAGAPMAHASLVVDLPLPELSGRAALVVRATVESQASAWNADRTRIFTTTRLRVHETMRGQVTVGSLVSVVQPGGVVGDVGQVVEGSAEFAVGEEVVVFLEPTSNRAHFTPISLAASKFAVQRGAKDVSLVRRFEGLSLMKRQANGRIVPIDAPPVSKIALDELRAIVRAAPVARVRQ